MSEPQLSWRGNTWNLGLCLCGLIAFGHLQTTRAADVESRPQTPKSYINKPKFHLPVILEGNSRNQVSEVHLYFKDSLHGPWKLYGKVQPKGQAKPGFNFQAPHEGEYCFTMVLIDKLGKSSPSKVEQAAPGLIVVFDTQPPQVDIMVQDDSPDGQQFQLDIRDENPDPAKCRCFFQTRDKVWRPLEAHAPGNRYCIPAQAASTGMIRVTAGDMAGNSVSHDFNLATLTATSAKPAVSPSVKKPAASTIVRETPIPAVVKEPTLPPSQPLETAKVLPSEDVLPSALPATSTKAAPIRLPAGTKTEHVVQKNPSVVLVSGAQENAGNYDVTGPALGAQKAAAKPASVLPTGDATPRHPKFINKSQLLLEYQLEKVGASGVGKVEVWLTRDLGKSWQKVGEDPDCKSPVAIELPGEGLYGVSLVVSNGRGFGGNPPVSGDTPEAWVEVDLTRPQAELVRVAPGTGDDSGTVLIQWNVQDKNLSSESVDLLYAPGRDGPWQSVAKGLHAEGRYRWVVPTSAGPQAFIRVVVHDQAGNSTTTESPQPLLLDDQSRPQGRLVGIAPFSPETARESKND